MLKIFAMDSANAATAALIAGSAPVVLSGPGELVAAVARSQPVVLVADVYRGFGASLVLSNAVAARTGVGAKIRFTYMAQPAMVAALENGAVEGMIASAPFWGFPVARKAGVLWLSGPKGELPPENMPVVPRACKPCGRLPKPTPDSCGS